jgi:hypothetical protein
MQLPDGSWVPSPDASVQSEQFGEMAYPPTYTDLNGKFSVGAEVYPGSPLAISAGGGWSGDATTGPLFLPLSADPTWVCGAIGADFTPAPVAGIGFSIRTCSEDATGAEHSYSGEVQMYFQPAGGSSWTLMGATTTGADGYGHVTVSGYLRGGQLAAGNWKWQVPAAPGFAASGTLPFSVVISVPTSISRVRFTRSGAQERLTGRLSFQTAGVPGARALIEHFSHGRWRQVASVQTNASGRFAYQFSPRRTGMYQIVYRGHALPGAEASDGSFTPALSGVARFR